MTQQRWTVQHMPDLRGKIAIVTGANSGLGYETVRGLAQKHAHVVLACRNTASGNTAKEQIVCEFPQATLEVMALDLASLGSVRAFVEAFLARHTNLHLLINNAGVMALPRRATADSFEMQFGTNHLGHFALTGLLMNALLATENSRIVTLSSVAHRFGKIDFDDLHGEKAYKKWVAYAQSKLANLLFAYELQRKLTTLGSSTISVAAHPGYAATNLQLAGPRMDKSSMQEQMAALVNRLMAQSAEMGALPTLYAATAPEVQGGDYIGPDGLLETRGYPNKVSSNSDSQDRAVAARLWGLSEKLTGVTYDQFVPLSSLG